MNWDKLGDKMKARLQREHPEQFGPQGIIVPKEATMTATQINATQIGDLKVPGPPFYADAQKPQRRKPKQIQSAEERLNKTESMLLVLLRARYGEKAVRIQAIRLELAPNCTYLPDFSVHTEVADYIGIGERVRTIFFEAKGGYVYPDAWIKLKTAARLYPEYDFWLCQWKNNKWTETLMPK